MRRLLPYISVLLLALWLPATEHCNLEAAGLITQQCAEDCGQTGAQSSDGCGIIESGSYKSAIGGVKAPVPELLACRSFLFLAFASLAKVAEPVAVPTEAVGRPRDWVTTWQFVQRAAPSPRAPSSLSA